MTVLWSQSQWSKLHNGYEDLSKLDVRGREREAARKRAGALGFVARRTTGARAQQSAPVEGGALGVL